MFNKNLIFEWINLLISNPYKSLNSHWNNVSYLYNYVKYIIEYNWIIIKKPLIKYIWSQNILLYNKNAFNNNIGIRKLQRRMTEHEVPPGFF